MCPFHFLRRFNWEAICQPIIVRLQVNDSAAKSLHLSMRTDAQLRPILRWIVQKRTTLWVGSVKLRQDSNRALLPVRLVAMHHELWIGVATQLVQIHPKPFAIGIDA
jgi:hypothetical protein